MSEPWKVSPQLTVRAVVLAVVLAVILAAANSYLGLFAGMTIDPAPARDNDSVGARYSLEAVVERDAEVTDAQRGSIGAARCVAVPPDSEVLAAVQAEELVGNRRFESAHPVDEHGHDPVPASGHGLNLANVANPDKGCFLAIIVIRATGSDEATHASWVSTYGGRDAQP